MSCSGVLVIDEESGIGVMCNTERSQHGNREKADAMLTKLLFDRLAVRP